MTFYDNNLNEIPTLEIRPIGDNSLLYEIFRRYIKTDLKGIGLISSRDLYHHGVINHLYNDFMNDNIELICVNVSDHKFNEGILQTLNLKIPYIVLVNEPYLNKDNCVYFPYWLLSSKIFSDSDSFDLEPKKYYVSCLNRNPRNERIYNFVKLKQLLFANEMYITFYQQYPNSNQFITNDSISDLDDNIKHLFFKEFNQLLINFNDQEQRTIMSIDYTGHHQSMLNVITETYHDAVYLSEKTFKPIRAKQLFLMCGSAYSIKHLRELGFDTFDDYIDHDYYDTELDWKKRIDKMHEVLLGVYSQIPTIYLETEYRRNNNRKYLINYGYNKIKQL